MDLSHDDLFEFAESDVMISSFPTPNPLCEMDADVSMTENLNPPSRQMKF